MSAREREQRANGLTLQRFGTQWIEERKKLAIRDASNEEQRLRDHVFPYLGTLPLTTLRASDLRDWVIELRTETELAPKTVHNIYGVLRSLVRAARVHGYIEIDPCILTQAELGKQRDKDPAWRATAIFDLDEISLLVAAPELPEAHRVTNALAGLGGLRQGEVCALRWSDIYRKAPLQDLVVVRSHFGNTKTDVARHVPVHPVLARMLAEWRLKGWAELVGRVPTDIDLVLPSERTKRGPAGRQRTKSMVYKRWRQDLNTLGLRQRRYHDLRRTFISLALAGGARRDVLERVTHQSLGSRSIDLYTTLPWPTLCDAVTALDFDLARAEKVAANRG